MESEALTKEMIPDELWEKLRVGDRPPRKKPTKNGGSVLNRALMIEVATLLKVEFKPSNQQSWNRLIDLLDRINPLWRGYEVPTVCTSAQFEEIRSLVA